VTTSISTPDGLIDLVFGERLTKMLFVSLLSADFAFFPSPILLLFRRFDEVGGRRLRGIAGILHETRHFGSEFSDPKPKLSDESRLLQCYFLPIHKTRYTPFSDFHKDQFSGKMGE
jgi:hypothetical protein